MTVDEYKKHILDPLWNIRWIGISEYRRRVALLAILDTERGNEHGEPKIRKYSKNRGSSFDPDPPSDHSDVGGRIRKVSTPLSQEM